MVDFGNSERRFKRPLHLCHVIVASHHRYMIRGQGSPGVCTRMLRTRRDNKATSKFSYCTRLSIPLPTSLFDNSF